MATTTVYPNRERLRRQRALAKPAENGWTRAIDSVVDLFAPGAGLKRRAQRAAIRELHAFSSSGSRGHSRITGPWTGIGSSADASLLPKLPDLRARSRELVEDNGLAAALVSTHTQNVVGAKGIRVQSNPDIEALGISPEQGEQFRRRAERSWRRWNRWCDATGRLDLAGFQELAVRTVLGEGDAILTRMMIEDPHRPYRLAFDLIDPDRLESPNGIDSEKVRSGIELDERGSPKNYWIRIGHPNDGLFSAANFKWREIPARDQDGRPNVLHSYIMRRPHQSRGAPLLAPVLNLFRDLEKLQEATVVRERIAACFAAMISTPDPEGTALLAKRDQGGAGGDERIEDLYPGQVEYLEPGQQITFGAPTGLAQPYAELVKGIVTQLAAACDLPYVLLTKDFSQLNFSSARAALLEARRMFRRLQHLLEISILVPMWELLLEEAWLRGELGDIDFDRDREAWCRATWVPPGWGWVDPVKEVEAAAMAIEKGLSTHAEECNALGRDWEETFEQQARERERREELGLAPISAAPSGAPADPEDDDEEKEKEAA